MLVSTVFPYGYEKIISAQSPSNFCGRAVVGWLCGTPGRLSRPPGLCATAARNPAARPSGCGGTSPTAAAGGNNHDRPGSNFYLDWRELGMAERSLGLVWRPLGPPAAARGGLGAWALGLSRQCPGLGRRRLALRPSPHTPRRVEKLFGCRPWKWPASDRRTGLPRTRSARVRRYGLGKRRRTISESVFQTRLIPLDLTICPRHREFNR